MDQFNTLLVFFHLFLFFSVSASTLIVGSVLIVQCSLLDEHKFHYVTYILCTVFNHLITKVKEQKREGSSVPLCSTQPTDL